MSIVDKLKRLKRYEEFFGDIDQMEKIGEWEGEVFDVELPDHPDGVRIAFDLPGGKTLVRVFPKDRIGMVRALFPTAMVLYEIYRIGVVNISILQYIGPSREELLAEEPARLSEEAIAELENTG